MDEVLVKLEAEQQTSESMRQLTQILREQLDQCNKENRQLNDSNAALKTQLEEAQEEAERLKEEKMHISGKSNLAVKFIIVRICEKTGSGMQLMHL